MLQRILYGKLRRGDAFDTEGRLAAQFGVSLGTVRKAVDELVAQNVLVRHQGRGTFIATHDSTAAARLHFHVVGRGRTPGVAVFRQAVERRNQAGESKQGKNLKLSLRASVIEMRRTKSWADESIMFERVYLPARLFPNFKRRLGQARPVLLYEFYEQEFGVSVMNFDERIRAVAATKADSELIDCAPGCALLEIERTAYGYDGTPVEFRISRCETRRRYYLHSRR
ncbi:MAG: GntR family transcriptional regulator [Betaproteobacteria bacterium]|nr:GntR family transcriptional regulator [Betaproteobacteria bacterium]